MADYNGKGRSGFRFRSWETSNDGRADWTNSDFFTTPNPHHDHVCRPVIIGSDGRAMPAVFESCTPPHHHKETVTVVEENVYRVQPANPYTVDHVAGGRRMGFPGGMFQRPKPDYSAPEPTLITNGGWDRPSPTGWKLPPEERLGKVTNDIGAAAEYLRESVAPPVSAGGNRWSSPESYPEFRGKKASATIDSREAVKRYGGEYM